MSTDFEAAETKKEKKTEDARHEKPIDKILKEEPMKEVKPIEKEPQKPKGICTTHFKYKKAVYVDIMKIK